MNDSENDKDRNMKEIKEKIENEKNEKMVK